MADACEYCIKRKWPYLRNFTPDADLSGLINLTLVPNISARELRQHWFMKWLVACSAPSHYLNQCCLVVNWTLRNKPQWNSNGNTKRFIHKNAFGNVVCESGGHFVQGGNEQLHPTVFFAMPYILTSGTKVLSGSRPRVINESPKRLVQK